MIGIFDYYSGGITGTNTSMIDILFSLRNMNIDVKYITHLSGNNQFRNLLYDINKNFSDKNLAYIVHKIVKSRVDEYKTVITNFYSITQCNIKIYCEKLIILDSTGVFNYKEFPYKNIVADKIIFLGNPSSYVFEDIDFIEYYHKLSLQRLEYIRPKLKTIKKSLTTNPIYDIDSFYHPAQFKRYFSRHNTNINNCDLSNLKINLSDRFPHDCRQFLYQRWYEIQPGIFAENIGKLIFEFLYFDKPVHYSNKNKTFNDGLHYYLELFGIDDNKTQEIKISPEEIKGKMVFNRDDLLLELL